MARSTPWNRVLEVRKGEAGQDLELRRAIRLRAVRFGFHAIPCQDRKLALRP